MSKMKVEYHKDDDVMVVEFNQKKVDDAKQSGDLIFHYSRDGDIVLLEILDATHRVCDVFYTRKRSRSER